MSAAESGENLPARVTRDLCVQTFLATMPGFGGVVRAWSGYSSERRFARLEAFLKGLKADFETLEHDVGVIRVQEEEFPTLMEEVLDRAERETRQEKITWLRAFLLGAILQLEDWNLSKRQVFLRVLDMLTAGELCMLALLFEFDNIGLHKGTTRQSCEYSRPGFPNVPRQPLPIPVEWGLLFLQNLRKSGLIRDFGAQDAAGYALTGIGREFIKAFVFPNGKPDVAAPSFD